MRHRPSSPNAAVVTAVVAAVVFVAVVFVAVVFVAWGAGLAITLGSQRASARTPATGLAAAGERATAGHRRTTDAPVTPGSTPAATTATPPGAQSGSATAPPATASTSAAGHRRATTVPTTGSSAAAAAGQAPGPAGPTPAAPGTYRYLQAGTLPGTPAEGTLVVAAASASGTQVWTRNVGGTMAPSTSVMLFNETGAYLISPGSQVGGTNASCSFASPVPWPPWPTTVGAIASAHASCAAPITSYQVTARVVGTVPKALGGQTVDTFVVVNTFVLSGTYSASPLKVSLTETDYYAPGLRVPVVTQTHMSGTAIGLPITTDRTDTLESATPS